MKRESIELLPRADELDIPALKEKYRQERDRRIRPDGQHQYLRSTTEFADTYESDPHTPRRPREPLSEKIDVAILGGGWSGILAGIHLRKAGVSSFRNIDHAGDFGGVWYWNRYPGLQCDNDAFCYLPMLEETGFMPSSQFSNGYEIREYARNLAERYALDEKALFHTLVTSLRWDESIHRWRVTTDRGDELRARFVVMANGLLNIPKLPDVPGIHEFRGQIFHTARWDYDYTGGCQENPILDRLADKRVAIVGTGATAIQVIPFLGRYTAQLYVLQRTPSTVDDRRNRPTDPEWVKTLRPGWQRERQANFQRGAIEGFLRGEPDLIDDIWTEINRNLNAELDAEGWPELSLEELANRREVMDFRVMERLRRRVDGIVEDRQAAEALKPYYRYTCKRPLSSNDFYSTFNRPNVKLIDVSATRGVERMIEKGFVADGVEYPIDCMILASGFEVTSDLDRRWGIAEIEGRDGLSLYDHWANGYRTLHGMMTHGFPNQLFIGLIQGGFNASIPETFNRQAEHIAYIVKEVLTRNATSAEPSEQAQSEWIRQVRETAIDISQLQRECTPSYFNNEGETTLDSEGRRTYRWYLGEPYGPGWDAFQQLLKDWRDNGRLEGLVLKRRGAQHAAQ